MNFGNIICPLGNKRFKLWTVLQKYKIELMFNGEIGEQISFYIKFECLQLFLKEGLKGFKTYHR